MEILDVMNGVTYYKCYIWVHQAIMTEVGQHKIIYGKTATPEFFARKGKYEMQSGSGNKPKSFTVQMERDGLDSSPIRCNMQQNLYLLWSTYTNLVWKHPSCKGN